MKNFSAEVSRDSVKLLSVPEGKVLESLPIVRANESHRNFIISTWVRSYEPHIRKLRIGPTDVRISTEAYRAGEAKVAERHWDKSFVVTSGDDNFTIHGWICAQEGYLWHVYVPPLIRSHGMAKGLVSAYAGLDYNLHKPWPKQPAGHTCRYNPWMGS